MTTSARPPGEPSASVQPTGRTAWSHALSTPLRSYLRTETSGAVVLLVGVLAALLWANLGPGSYREVWDTRIAVSIGHSGVSLTLRDWINSGLMTFFFFVVGLEARREIDLGELRERRRSVVPALAAFGGMAAAVAIYLAINAGHHSAHGWGAAMSTDTAVALGLLALVGPPNSERLRAFLLTVVVVDDIVALAVIGVVYTGSFRAMPLLAGAVTVGAAFFLCRLQVRIGALLALLGAVAWVAVLKSGVDPVVVGLVMGLLTYAYTAERSSLEQATERFREFREQPTAGLARAALAQLRSATSTNERFQELWHPWTSYAIVPLFAVANAGIRLDRELITRAASSPVTLGILFGLAVGKPVGIFAMSWINTRLTGGRLRPPVGWASVVGGGTIAGIGFTVALLIASRAFSGRTLDEAKVGILASALAALATTWLVFRLTAMLPAGWQIRALVGHAEPLLDLAVDVEPQYDHIRGPIDAPVTIVEYGDFECPFCGRAEPIIREVLGDFQNVRYVWRHLPLNDVHPNAQVAAQASEAAAAQGAFWRMHDLLLERQGALEPADLVEHARQLGLDVDRFSGDVAGDVAAKRVAEDVDSADLSGVTGTPTFFINGRRHFGAYDVETLSEAVRAAGAVALHGAAA
jgi:Na+/H+ antiporter NhaA